MLQSAPKVCWIQCRPVGLPVPVEVRIGPSTVLLLLSAGSVRSSQMSCTGMGERDIAHLFPQFPLSFPPLAMAPFRLAVLLNRKRHSAVRVACQLFVDFWVPGEHASYALLQCVQ